MRKHVEESVATGAAAGRGRGGRFSAGCKREVVMRLLRGEDLESVSRAVGITAARASHWRAQFLAAGQAGLKSRATDARDDDHRRLQAKIGELLMETGCCMRRWTPAGGPRPFGPAEVDAMSGAQSISTRRAYGVHDGSAACGTAPAPACMRGVRRPRPRRRVVAAVRSAPPRMTSWWPTFVGCSKPRRFMARATEKCGRSCGLRGGAPRRSGCGG